MHDESRIYALASLDSRKNSMHNLIWSLLPGSARSSHKQLPLQNHLACGTIGIGNALQKEFRRRFANLISRLVNQCDRGLNQCCPCSLIKSDQSYIVRNGKIAFSNGLQGTCSEQAIRCQEGIGWLCSIKYFQSSHVPRLDLRLYIFVNVIT